MLAEDFRDSPNVHKDLACVPVELQPVIDALIPGRNAADEAKLRHFGVRVGELIIHALT